MISTFVPSHYEAGYSYYALLSSVNADSAYNDASNFRYKANNRTGTEKAEAKTLTSQNASQLEQTLQERIEEVYNGTRIRILVVDDHDVVRKGMCTILAEEKDFEVVGQANNSSEAITLARQLKPDIILLDIFLGRANGLDLAQQLQRASADTRIVIFTGVTEEDYLLRAMRIGVHGYLQKSLPLDEVLTALRAVYRGERVIGEQHAVTQVLSEFSRLTKEQERSRSGLTDLEIELIRQAAEGHSNKEIASHQFWSEVTVKRKMQDIYRKLQATDRAQAVAEAIRMGLI
ncbi:MAG: response regulator transcription factor [Ktedonobacteraceae bacterium]|nr:response regulator transcription factor [Ktedonobacteraceae bacterium]